MTLIQLKDLEAHLWHAAHIITGPIDASEALLVGPLSVAEYAVQAFVVGLDQAQGILDRFADVLASVAHFFPARLLI